MTKLVVLAALFTINCGSSSKCTLSVETVSVETMGGQAIVTGDFSQGAPIMVLTTSDLPTFIECTVTADLMTATCNIGGLVSPGTFGLSFDAECNNDGDGVVDSEAGDSYAVIY